MHVMALQLHNRNYDKCNWNTIKCQLKAKNDIKNTETTWPNTCIFVAKRPLNQILTILLAGSELGVLFLVTSTYICSVLLQDYIYIQRHFKWVKPFSDYE